MRRIGGQLVLLSVLGVLGCSGGAPPAGGGTGGHAGAAGSGSPGGASGQTGAAGRGGTPGAGGGVAGGASGAGGSPTGAAGTGGDATGGVTGVAGAGGSAAGAGGSATGGGPGSGGAGGNGAGGSGGASGQAGSGSAPPSLTLLAGLPGGGIGNVDGIGSAAHFQQLNGIASDGAGNVYVTDNYNNTVRKIVVATGAVTTLAAGFYEPSGITSDGAGNLYVAETSGRKVRKIAIATGAVTTLASASTGLTLPRAITSDGAGNLFVTDAAHAIRKIVIATGALTTVVAERVRYPEDLGISASFIASDGAGNLYVAESFEMQKVVIATGAVTPFMDATGAPVPNGTLAGDGAGNLYVGVWGNGMGTIKKIVAATGVVTTLTDATGAPVDASGNLGLDGMGNLYTAVNNTVQKVSLATGAVTFLAGGWPQKGSADGTGAAARFNAPNGIVSDGAGNVYVADGDNYTIRKIVLATGAVTTFAGTAGMPGTTDGTGAAARFAAPGALAIDAGILFVGDENRIRKVDLATGAVTVLVGVPGPGGYRDGTGTSAYFSGLGGLAPDGAGNLYVADSGNQVIRKVVVATRVATTLAGTAGQWGYTDATGTSAQFDGPGGLVLDGAGNLYVTDGGNRMIRKMAIATRQITTFAGGRDSLDAKDGTLANARFSGPVALALDGAGNLYVHDMVANPLTSTIRKIAIGAGTVSTVIGAPDRVGVSLGALPASLCLSSGIAALPTGDLAIVARTENAILIGHL